MLDQRPLFAEENKPPALPLTFLTWGHVWKFTGTAYTGVINPMEHFEHPNFKPPVTSAPELGNMPPSQRQIT